MSKLLPGLTIGLSVALFPLAAIVLPAVAEETATVTLDQTVIDALGVPGLTSPLVVTVTQAQDFCDDANVVAGGTCAGVDVAALSSYLASSSSQPPSSSEPDNSAKAFAPGQLKQDGESAASYAPGHNKGDDGNAKDEAPGQQKKNNSNG